MFDQPTARHSIEFAADIVAAFVSNNNVTVADLPSLITNVHVALTNLGQPAPPERERSVPPISIKRTITPDFLISLEDGQRYKSLRRHLTARGLSPEQYRQKWGLPTDYPMVAPSYSARRSELARSMGLGRKRKEATKAASTSDKVSAKAPAKAAKKSGRKKSGG